MKHNFFYKWFSALLLLLMCGFSQHAAAADDFLDPEQAFKLQAELRDAKTLVLSWTIAKDYHLYRERLSFNATEPGITLGAPKLPDGIRKFDTTFNKEVETYADRLLVELPITKADKVFTLKVGYQGCADAGLCYPPAEQHYRVDTSTPGKLTLQAVDATTAVSTTPAVAATATATAPAASESAHKEDDSSLAQRTLQSGSLWRIGMAFLVFGLLLSFTPCVLPMVPILSSIIVGEGNVSRGRGFMLALAYCLGMALVYTLLGVAAGLAGEGLAGALQKPWVLLTFGALLIGLALSMFDVYQLQLPGGLQSRLSQASGNFSGGKFLGVFVMGALSALIVGPCVAGPLAGALLYISQTRNVLIGAWALFSMAVGMSVPLLLTGISAGSLLPRAGAWMNQVKKLFGLLLIAVAIWMVSPVFPVKVMMAVWGGFAILCAVFLHVFDALPAGAGLRAYVAKALGISFLFLGLFELIGAASDGKDVLQPLAHLRGTANAAQMADAGSAGNHAENKFTRIKSVAELDAALAATNTPVILDFYADWCVSCKEMERFTFSEPKVSEQLKQVRLLQVDVTANSDMEKALMKRFSLFGPPGIILFDRSGKEVPDSRIIGYLEPERFVQHLSRHFAL
ncbi:protein-disulfide reductase DsbD [Undibacterium sp. CY18W]|uniref:Thiol:disulfide interchange protein DsbD n=1 Tax=Undibacterium hunanense TaxID=2762292 RepID=A0ABR6ZQL2_9BURK|nr:protein-disulfide reductase DsbD [Undibacterium hunanense]MBC3918169.1 protein-disulfide reductase DsbD [Undibacterium hunanense]